MVNIFQTYYTQYLPIFTNISLQYFTVFHSILQYFTYFIVLCQHFTRHYNWQSTGPRSLAQPRRSTNMSKSSNFQPAEAHKSRESDKTTDTCNGFLTI